MLGSTTALLLLICSWNRLDSFEIAKISRPSGMPVICARAKVLMGCLGSSMLSSGTSEIVSQSHGNIQLDRRRVISCVSPIIRHSPGTKLHIDPQLFPCKRYVDGGANGRHNCPPRAALKA